jgi:hypothetical protein
MSTLRGLGRCCAVSILAVAGIGGCATAFSGNPRIPGGANGCRNVCGGYGMDLAGMVAMGEYSDGCICKVRGQTAKSDDTTLAVAGAGPAAVAVVLDARRRDEEARRATLFP